MRIRRSFESLDERLVEKRLKLAFYITLFAKLLFFVVFYWFDGMSLYPMIDAIGYNQAALGLNNDSRFWPSLLRLMNDFDLYSRGVLRWLIFISDCVLVPYFLFKVIKSSDNDFAGVYWFGALMVSLYPALTFFSLDIVRDLPMVLLFLLALVQLRKLTEISSGMQSIKYFNINILILASCMFLLFKLRFYLAISLGVSFFIGHLAHKNFRWTLNIVLYFGMLLLMNEVGLFDQLKYVTRPLESSLSKSPYGISFLDEPFLLAYIKSFVKGVYGVHYNGIYSIGFFIFESIPAIVATVFLAANRKSFDKFTYSLVIFFFMYPVPWVIGMDALGTAIRYRIFNYLALMIACVILMQARNKDNLINVE